MMAWTRAAVQTKQGGAEVSFGGGIDSAYLCIRCGSGREGWCGQMAALPSKESIYNERKGCPPMASVLTTVFYCPITHTV